MQQNLIYLKENEEPEFFGKPESYDYSKYKELDGFNLDENLMKDFLNIANKLNLSQHSFQILMDMAFNMSKNRMKLLKMQQKQNSITIYLIGPENLMRIWSCRREILQI